jgi:hypothetical protein
MPIKFLGNCRPGEQDGCADPLSPSELESIIDTLPLQLQQGAVNLLIPGQIEIPLPPKIALTTIQVVSHQENRQFGLFHFKELKTIWVACKTLEKIVGIGLFRPGNYYYHLVYAINAIGLKAVDVEYIIDEAKSPKDV